MTALHSLSVSARLTLDMHSLNNEGGEGNQTQTRMVNIVGENGQLYNVNAVSGDMLKHILAEHFWRIALRDGLTLCKGCQTFNANRISADEDFMALAEDKSLSDSKLLTELLERCALDDIAGNLITAGGRSMPRKSVVEFGWMVGLPEVTTSDSYFHVKYANERSGDQRDADSEEGARKANLGQAIFHRPASSGVYAAVVHLELARIGFNDITQQYVLDEAERKRRYDALVEALLYTFLEPNGAMRGTQHPHILGAEGAVAVSSSVTPAPTISPLHSGYYDEINGIAESLNGLRPGAITVNGFGSLTDFSTVLTGLIQNDSAATLTYGA